MEQVKRVISALVVLPPLILFLLYVPAAFFLVLVMLLVVLGMHEYVRMLARCQFPVSRWGTYVAASMLTVAAYLGGGRWLTVILFLSIVGITVGVMLTSQAASVLFPMWLSSAFGVLFIGWGLSHLVVLRGLPAGKWYILFLWIMIWVGDSCAMYVGKLLGRRKMAPTLSPGKTWEGAVGGMIGGVLAAVVGAGFLLPHLVLWHSVVIGLTVSLAAQVGDLGESMVKRYAGVKDSGQLIPGHGGMLDRVDSLLFATPMLVYVLEALGNVSAS